MASPIIVKFKYESIEGVSDIRRVPVQLQDVGLAQFQSLAQSLFSLSEPVSFWRPLEIAQTFLALDSDAALAAEVATVQSTGKPLILIVMKHGGAEPRAASSSSSSGAPQNTPIPKEVESLEPKKRERIPVPDMTLCQVLYLCDKYDKCSRMRALYELVRFGGRMEEAEKVLKKLEKEGVLAKESAKMRSKSAPRGQQLRRAELLRKPMYLPKALCSKVLSLEAMGFERGQVAEALIANGGSVTETALALMEKLNIEKQDGTQIKDASFNASIYAAPLGEMLAEEDQGMNEAENNNNNNNNNNNFELPAFIKQSVLAIEQSGEFPKRDRAKLTELLCRHGGDVQATLEELRTLEAKERERRLEDRIHQEQQKILASLPRPTTAALVQLSEMGFDHTLHNLALLDRYNNDVAKVIAHLNGEVPTNESIFHRLSRFTMN